MLAAVQENCSETSEDCGKKIDKKGSSDSFLDEASMITSSDLNDERESDEDSPIEEKKQVQI